MTGRAACLLALLLAPPSGADEVRPAGPPRIPGARTAVVRVDAVVTDEKGRYVTDLTADDFEIVEDGKRQDVTNFEYVVTGGAAAAPADPLAPLPAVPPTASTARRTVAIVVDDLSFDFESLVRARWMLTHLVDEQLGPGDVAAIVRTGGGMGNLQQFTSDRLLLKAAARGIPFSLARLGALNGLDRPTGRVEGTASAADAAAIGGSGAQTASRGLDPTVRTAGAPEATGAAGEASAALGAYLLQADKSYRVYRTLGSLTVLEQVMKSLATMPGRKSLLFVSQGFVSRDDWGNPAPLDERLRAIAEEANRGSIVFYALDPGGLKTLQGGPGEGPVRDATAGAAAQRDLRSGMTRLTQATGGLELFDTNDLSRAVQRMFDDQRGYYLLGYQPSPDSASAAVPRLHALTVKVARRGLRVRSRRAFASGGRDPDAPTTSSFAAALLSPFAAVEIPVKLTVLFNHEAKRGAFLRCLVHMDTRQLTLEEGTDGARSGKVEAGVVAVAPSGRVVQKAGGLYTFTVPRESADSAESEGLVLTLDLPAERGGYQVRAAVRDVANERAGAASQFVIVPDMHKRPLALSGLVMTGGAGTPGSAAAVRRFHGGSSVAYAFGVYNARPHGDDGKPRLSATLLLFRDGRRMEEVPIRVASELTPQEGVTPVSGSLRLSPQMPPGLYTLEVLVKDALRPPKESVALQWIDFEVGEPATQ